MDFTASDRKRRITSAKVVVTGGFGVGKTTFVGSISEIVPLRTEALMTSASIGVDETEAVPDKQTTTVAMDFGRITLAEDLVLYLFGTPGQHRFWFMWDDVIRGSVGAVVLVDTRRLADCFGPIDYLESRGVPFVVAVNRFDGATSYSDDAVREALAIATEIPVLTCDARSASSVKGTLIAASEHAMTRLRAAAPRPI